MLVHSRALSFSTLLHAGESSIRQSQHSLLMIMNYHTCSAGERVDCLIHGPIAYGVNVWLLQCRRHDWQSVMMATSMLHDGDGNTVLMYL